MNPKEFSQKPYAEMSAEERVRIYEHNSKIRKTEMLSHCIPRRPKRLSHAKNDYRRT